MLLKLAVFSSRLLAAESGLYFLAFVIVNQVLRKFRLAAWVLGETARTLPEAGASCQWRIGFNNNQRGLNKTLYRRSSGRRSYAKMKNGLSPSFAPRLSGVSKRAAN